MASTSNDKEDEDEDEADLVGKSSEVKGKNGCHQFRFMSPILLDMNMGRLLGTIY